MKKCVFHPFLFAVFPIVSLYAHNVNLVLFEETVVPMAIAVTLATVLMLLCSCILRDIQRGGIVVSGVLLFFYTFGHVFSSISNFQIASFQVGRHVYFPLLIWSLILAFYTYCFARPRIHPHNLTQILNVVAIFLILMPLIRVAAAGFELSAGRANAQKTRLTELGFKPSKKPARLPDIYYIVVDRYADPRTLKDTYQFDNKEFLDYLSNKGFYVASASRSNYLKTAHSLASSLNMEYLNHLSENLGRDSGDWLPLYEMMQDHRVWHFLKSQGYQYIHLGSWWEPTRQNQNADINFIFDPLPHLFYVMYRQTMLFPISRRMGILDLRLIQWKRELYNFATLATLPPFKQPTFVFAHILITHEPYVFDQEGRFLTVEDGERRSRRENYVNQVRFANKKLKAWIDGLLSTATVQPIIVLQSDEGPWPMRYFLNEWTFDWRKASQTELKQKMGILNAYYLPGVEKTSLYNSVTPVNSFRIIFNLYFGTNLPLLPDKNYAFTDERHLYDFFEVTEVVR